MHTHAAPWLSGSAARPGGAVSRHLNLKSVHRRHNLKNGKPAPAAGRPSTRADSESGPRTRNAAGRGGADPKSDSPSLSAVFTRRRQPATEGHGGSLPGSTSEPQ
jgi:hypothetical protein